MKKVGILNSEENAEIMASFPSGKHQDASGRLVLSFLLHLLSVGGRVKL